MSIAIYDPPPGGAAALAPNVSQKVIGIRLNTGNNLSPFWVITGKVVVASASAVSVRAQLVAVAPPATGKAPYLGPVQEEDDDIEADADAKEGAYLRSRLSKLGTAIGEPPV